MSQVITAADLLGFRLCTGQCLLGLEEACVCRCLGRWHAVLADAEIPIPDTLTLAEALQAGPAGYPQRRRQRPRRQQGNAAATPEAAELNFAAELAAGYVPSIRQIRATMRCGQPRAQALQQQLQRALDRRLTRTP